VAGCTVRPLTGHTRHSPARRLPSLVTERPRAPHIQKCAPPRADVGDRETPRTGSATHPTVQDSCAASLRPGGGDPSPISQSSRPYGCWCPLVGMTRPSARLPTWTLSEAGTRTLAPPDVSVRGVSAGGRALPLLSSRATLTAVADGVAAACGLTPPPSKITSGSAPLLQTR